MKRFIPILLLATFVFSYKSDAQFLDHIADCLSKAKSCYEPQPAVNIRTFPSPFEEYIPGTINGEATGVRWPHNSPAVSTGYYFTTSRLLAGDYSPFWRPTFLANISPGSDGTWLEITSGHRIQDPSFWDSQKNDEGMAFFRNPGNDNWPADNTPLPYLYDANGDPVSEVEGNRIDTTYDAIAGPIPLNAAGAFRFNNIRYDSFYVSTNGLIGFSNRRYLYDANGGRQIDPVTGDAYDRESMDWFIRGRAFESSTMSKDPTVETTPDNFGHLFVALGNQPGNPRAGLRSPGGPSTGNNLTNLPFNAPVVSPFYGDLHLSQYDDENELDDPHGKVFYRRSINRDTIIISFVNITLQGLNRYCDTGCDVAIPTECDNVGGNYFTRSNVRPSNNRYFGASADVMLNLNNQSIEIHYRRFVGQQQGGGFPPCVAQANNVFRFNTEAGVRGFARHQNYGRSLANSVNTPEYQQSTTYFSFNDPTGWDIARLRNQIRTYPEQNTAIRFQQWQNTLRVVDIQYLSRFALEGNGANRSVNPLEFNTTPVEDAENYELLAGELRLGAIQPLAIIQNLSNNIQGFNGQNFVEQDLEFGARFRIFNDVSGRLAYGKITPVNNFCLGLSETISQDCTGDPSVRVRLITALRSAIGDDYTSIIEYTPTVDDPAAILQFPGNGADSPSGNPYNGVPPYGMVRVSFPPFEPSELDNDNIGRLNAVITSVPKDANNRSLGDEWPFDDTTSITLFVMKRLTEFHDDGNEFHVDGRSVSRPSVLKWVTIGSEMVSSEELSKHPLPPRGRVGAQFVEEPISERWTQQRLDIAKNIFLNSPMIKMNRLIDGADPSTGTSNYGGDEIISFPIDMRGKFDAVLSLSVQRNAYSENWERGFGDGSMIGPEPRVIFNGRPLTRFDNQNFVRNRNSAAYPDAIVVELLNNSVSSKDDRLAHVTNVDDSRWNLHFRRGGASELSGGITPGETGVIPALRLFGGGGYQVGFLESDPDSALGVPANGQFNSLRPNQFDDGIDEEFRKFFIAIPDTFVNFEYNVAQNFRFRIRVEASNDNKNQQWMRDDDDDFFVDNVEILFPGGEIADVETSVVKTAWPYTTVPASQATRVPVNVVLTNNTSNGTPVYSVKVKIYKGDDTNSDPIYCRVKNIQTHNPRQQINVFMPPFNAREAGPGEYTMEAIALVPGTGAEERVNDTTFYTYNIDFSGQFAYDPVENPANNVPNPQFGRPAGRGINFFAAQRGGTGSPGGQGFGSYVHSEWTAGVTGASGRGEIAMKFTLVNVDTLRGYSAFYAPLNSSPDFVQFSVWESTEGSPGDAVPSRIIENSILNTRRGQDDTRDIEGDDPYLGYDEYVNQTLSEGVVLQPGTYWIVLTQLGETGLEVGASSYRGGMRTTNVFYVLGQEAGANGTQLVLHDDLKYFNGSDWVNDNLFAYQNSSEGWVRMVPLNGNPGLAHLGHYGIPSAADPTRTLTRGFWIPMIRPFFGEKGFGNVPTNFECADDLTIELSELTGNAVNNSNQLWWQTIVENNNKGFFIERKLSEQDEYSWNEIDFVNGAGIGEHAGGSDYSYVDASAKPFVSYDYRVKTVNIEDFHDCKTTNVVTIQNGSATDLTVTQEIYPNPFFETAKFEVLVPQSDFVTVEISDLQGNVIKTLHSGVHVGNLNLEWAGDNETGSKVASGSYIYKVQSTNEVVTGKVNFINK